MREQNNPSYYAIIPANVRYDNSLIEGAKLMFGEITALSNKYGYCNASNGYFAELYGRTPQCISKWINTLKRSGYVHIKEIKHAPGEIERRIYIVDQRVSTVVEGYQPELRGVSTVVEHNNTSNNSIDQNDVFDPNTPVEENSTPEWEIRFNEFWSRIWRKVGKKKSKTAFKNLTKTKQLACMAIETMDRYKKYLEITGYDAMHPLTWINGERWEDDFAAVKQQGANTDEALNDRLLPEPMDTDYQKYIAYVIDTFPSLWKSKCQVLSKSQWYELTQTEVFPGLKFAMTPRKAKQLRADMHKLFNEKAFERAKYNHLYEAIKDEYKRHINHEQTLIA